MEINPNHPTTQAARDHWHKIAALIMQKLGVDEVVITFEDIAALADSNTIIVLDGRREYMKVFLTDRQTAERLAEGEDSGLSEPMTEIPVV